MIDLQNLAKNISYGGPAYPIADHVAFLSGELFFDVLLLGAIWWIPRRFRRRCGSAGLDWATLAAQSARTADWSSREL
jgi:hypothetical protein